MESTTITLRDTVVVTVNAEAQEVSVNFTADTDRDGNNYHVAFSTAPGFAPTRRRTNVFTPLERAVLLTTTRAASIAWVTRRMDCRWHHRAAVLGLASEAQALAWRGQRLVDYGGCTNNAERQAAERDAAPTVYCMLEMAQRMLDEALIALCEQIHPNWIPVLARGRDSYGYGTAQVSAY